MEAATIEQKQVFVQLRGGQYQNIAVLWLPDLSQALYDGYLMASF